MFSDRIMFRMAVKQNKDVLYRIFTRVKSSNKLTHARACEAVLIETCTIGVDDDVELITAKFG